MSRGLPPKRTVPVRKVRLQPRLGPARCPEYLAWIRTLPCAVCSTVSGGATVIEAAHTSVLGPGGMSQKTTDFSVIPLCSGHHRESQDSYHRLGEQGFSHRHGIDLKYLVFRLQSRFRRRNVASRAVNAVAVGYAG